MLLSFIVTPGKVNILKMKHITIVAVLLTCLLLNGCASIALSFVDNSKKGEKNNIYIGTRAEYKTLTFSRNKDGVGSIANWVVWPFALIDFPLCILADTLLLPYLYFNLDDGKKDEDYNG